MHDDEERRRRGSDGAQETAVWWSVKSERTLGVAVVGREISRGNGRVRGAQSVGTKERECVCVCIIVCVVVVWRGSVYEERRHYTATRREPEENQRGNILVLCVFQLPLS